MTPDCSQQQDDDAGDGNTDSPTVGVVCADRSSVRSLLFNRECLLDAAMSILFICIIASDARSGCRIGIGDRFRQNHRRDLPGRPHCLYQRTPLLAAVADDGVPVAIRFGLVAVATWNGTPQCA